MHNNNNNNNINNNNNNTMNSKSKSKGFSFHALYPRFILSEDLDKMTPAGSPGDF